LSVFQNITDSVLKIYLFFTYFYFIFSPNYNIYTQFLQLKLQNEF